MKKRYAEMWETRKNRYGETGRVPKGKWMQFKEKVEERMDRNRRARKKLIKYMKKGKKRTILLKKLRSAYRHRPVKLGYWRGDQIKPLSFTKSGIKQFQQTHKIDRELKGTSKEYGEFWENDRDPRTKRDRVYKEWKAMARGKRKLKKMV